jgi:hypothetical protein
MQAGSDDLEMIGLALLYGPAVRKAIGLAIPETFLVRADEVIE